MNDIFDQISALAKDWDDEERAVRKLRPDLTPEELERLQKYGSVHFESAGATRKR